MFVLILKHKAHKPPHVILSIHRCREKQRNENIWDYNFNFMSQEVLEFNFHVKFRGLL